MNGVRTDDTVVSLLYFFLWIGLMMVTIMYQGWILILCLGFFTLLFGSYVNDLGHRYKVKKNVRFHRRH